MKKLSIAIDMGAKNNGIFIVKSEGSKILQKKATNIVIDNNNINFSKKSRRENRHKDRNYKRRKLAKRLLEELIDLKAYSREHKESIFGLLNNRGYTFLSTQSEFEELSSITIEFAKTHLQDLANYSTKESLEEYLTNNFKDEKELLAFLDDSVQNITKQSSNLLNFINKKKILADLDELETNSISKFKAFTYIKFMLFRCGYRDLGKNEKEITTKLKTEDVDLSKVDFEKERASIDSLTFNSNYSKSENKKAIIDDLKLLKAFLQNVAKEIATGAKPRKKYLLEIKDEIEKLDFIENKESFYHLIANISNLQLRVLRKFFNHNSSHNSKFDILKNYFVSHHYKSQSEKSLQKELMPYLNKHHNIKEFLQKTPPHLTIPPYEDMNNRDTYKCNSMLIKPSIITNELKEAVDYILTNPQFEQLKLSEEGVFTIKKLIKNRVIEDNQLIKTDFTYSKYLQRILDATPELTSRELNPRNVFKHQKKFERGTIDSVVIFKKEFGEKIYNALRPIAKKYYEEESKIHSGIYDESTSILTPCHTNTPYKNNAKHLLLKPIYSYSFTPKEAEDFLENIKETKGLQTALKRVADEAKKYQNSFYHIVDACYNNEKCLDDKEIKTIVKNLNKNLQELKTILGDKETYLKELEELNSSSLKRVLNTFLQTYNILFKELSGFNKTCKHCTAENAIRSDESHTIAKRLLSDVAKPIDGMLDMMLNRVAFEIVEDIEPKDIEDIESLEILLEQNRFEFEENLNTIKRANNSQIKKYKRDNKDRLNISICPYSGEKFDKGDWDHILPQSQGVYNSKANMIYVSSDGNQNIKGSRNLTLEELAKPHLKAMFKDDDITKIKSIIKEGLSTIQKEQFSNFDNLKLHQQIALRYALFMRGTPEFNKAFELLKLDKLKTITNGTQKRLARFVYEKLVEKYPNIFKNISVDSKTIDNKLVSTTRNLLSDSQEVLKKQKIQDSHSHCIDAMVVFHLANSKAQRITKADNTKEMISKKVFYYNFEDIYLNESSINHLSKRKTFINSPKKELGSYKLFDDTIYSEHYKHISKELLKDKKSLKDKDLKLLIEYQLLFINRKNKKIFIENSQQIEDNTIYQIDVAKTSNLIYGLFNKKDKSSLVELKFLDKLQYFTSRKEIQNIFFDEKQTKLKEFSQIKSIPPYSTKLYRAIYKKLQNLEGLFNISDEGKSTLNSKVLEEFQTNLYASKQKDSNKQERKRGKKRHKFTLPIMGSPKFRIKRGDTWQVLGNKDIATKNYLIDGNIKPIAFFSKNTISLKITDLLDCLLLDKNTQSIYDVEVNIEPIIDYVSKLQYLVSEAKRCTVIVTFSKKSFIQTYNWHKNNRVTNVPYCYKIPFIGLDNIKLFDGAKDQQFRLFLEYFIENKNSSLSRYIGSIRDGLKGKATILDNNTQSITLQYKAGINSAKKQIIIDNLNETYHSK